MTIRAEVWSDDRQMEIDFDAEPWFAQASIRDLLALMAENYSHGQKADEVAEFFARTTTKELFKYLEVEPEPYGYDLPIGFEVQVNINDAEPWLDQYYPDLVWLYENRATLHVIPPPTSAVHPVEYYWMRLSEIWPGLPLGFALRGHERFDRSFWREIVIAMTEVAMRIDFLDEFTRSAPRHRPHISPRQLGSPDPDWPFPDALTREDVDLLFEASTIQNLYRIFAEYQSLHQQELFGRHHGATVSWDVSDYETLLSYLEDPAPRAVLEPQEQRLRGKRHWITYRYPWRKVWETEVRDIME